MRRRGYDVEALPNTNWVINDIFRKEGFTWQQRFLNPDGSDVNYDFTDNWNARRKDGEMTTKKLGLYISEKISQDGRYEIYCAWEKGGGHTFCAERINGKIRFFDPQTGQNDYAYKLKEMDLNNIGIIRIDDKLINPKMMGMLRVKQS